MPLPIQITSRLRLPMIAAPMLKVSGPELVAAACRNGIIGAFPTLNAGSSEELDSWLGRIEADLAESPAPAAPVCPNLVMRRRPEALDGDIAVLVKHKVEMVIVSVGSPAPVVERLHDVGCLVFTDVASVRNAEKALEAGADGLVLLGSGAGGHTGWANGMAFVRAVRAMYEGPVVLAGGISDGTALWAARVLGCDLGLAGTPFIATAESMAVDAYKQMLVDSRLDDVILTQAFTGLDTNTLRASILAAGIDPNSLGGPVTPERARELFSEYSKEARGPKRWVDIWAAGHTVSGVDKVRPVAALVSKFEQEYVAARSLTNALLNEAVADCHSGDRLPVLVRSH